MDMNEWKYAPLWSMGDDKPPRDAQIRIINHIITAMHQGYKNIIVEAGTGIGKSAIATTISNYVNKSYILTRTKQLQQQYLSDFNDILTEIKGKGNYPCLYIYDNKTMCDSCVKVAQKQRTCELCKFKSVKSKAQTADTTLANYHYLWNASKYDISWTPRDLIILDEAHKFEEFVMSVVSRTLSHDYYLNHYGLDLFDGIKQGDTLTEWSQPEKWVPVLEKLIEKFRQEKHELTEHAEYLESNNAELPSISKKISSLNKRITNFNEFKNTMVTDNWIVILPCRYEIERNYSRLQVEFKPVNITKYTSDFLNLGNTRLFLTGTIGNFEKFCEWINIDSNESYLIQSHNNFPVSNRPIIKEYVGNLKGNSNGVPNWKTKRVLDKVRGILNKHFNEKGIIHTTSHSQSNWLYENLKNEFLLWKVSSDKNYNPMNLTREELITRFKYTDKPVVLLSAGMKDGVDFPDDECRFQILLKMPIPRFDAQVYERNRQDRLWVPYQTVMDTVQAYGRGVRHEKDYCVFYVLDKYLDSLLFKYRDLFTDSFLEAIQGVVKPRRVPKPIRVNGGK